MLNIYTSGGEATHEPFVQVEFRGETLQALAELQDITPNPPADANHTTKAIERLRFGGSCLVYASMFAAEVDPKSVEGMTGDERTLFTREFDAFEPPPKLISALQDKEQERLADELTISDEPFMLAAQGATTLGLAESLEALAESFNPRVGKNRSEWSLPLNPHELEAIKKGMRLPATRISSIAIAVTTENNYTSGIEFFFSNAVQVQHRGTVKILTGQSRDVLTCKLSSGAYRREAGSIQGASPVTWEPRDVSMTPRRGVDETGQILQLMAGHTTPRPQPPLPS